MMDISYRRQGFRCEIGAVIGFCLLISAALSPAMAEPGFEPKQVQTKAFSYIGDGFQPKQVQTQAFSYIGKGQTGPEFLEAAKELAGQLDPGDQNAMAKGTTDRQTTKRVKAKIKGVHVVQGTNLFDPSDKRGQTAGLPPIGGTYRATIAVKSDPCGLEPKIGLARGTNTLTVGLRGNTVDISGGPPFVKVSGPLNEGRASLNGTGPAGGENANVAADAGFENAGRNRLTMDYVITLPGRCTGRAGANAVAYQVTARKQ